MRVAHIAPAHVNPYSGVLTALVGLAGALARGGCEVEVWQLSRWDGPDLAPFRDQLAAAGVLEVAMPVRGPLRLGDPSLLAAADRRVDVVHLHNVFNLANVLVARRLGSPYVVSPHGGYAAPALSFRRRRKMVFRRLFELGMLQRAAAVCALTEVEAAEVRRFGVASPVRVVGNGTAPPPPVDGAAFRAELGIGAAPLAVFTGRLDLYHKRLDRLIAAAAAAPGWHVALVGPDFRGGRARLAELAAATAVDGRIHLTGPRRGPALYEAVAAADVFVLPSRWEGFPVALLEAAAVGTPALVSPAVEERIGVAAAGAAAVVADDDWGEALRACAAAPQGAVAARAAAARRFAAAHGWDAVATRFREVYESVAG